MINKKINDLQAYCCDDISKIENYNKAMNDLTQTWQCHHKLEIELYKDAKELKEMGLYYNRPAEELIFLTPFEHKSLHGKNKTEKSIQKQSNSLTGHIYPSSRNKKISESLQGKHLSEVTKRKQSKTKKDKCLHWYTDGMYSILANKCPDGFKPGRVYKNKKRII